VTPIALTIAGSDSGGGAGIQADLKTFAALGVFGASAITALTAQNTRGVRAIHLAPVEIVVAQINAVLEDFDVAAIKIGMLGSVEIVEAVAGRLRAAQDKRSGTPPFIVYDPVMVASSGDALAGAGFLEAIRSRLLPLVDCLTPNLAEASALLEAPAASSEHQMAAQAMALAKLGPRAVLVKGGHLVGDAVDILVTSDAIRHFGGPRIASSNLHGTGCTLSSAIAAHVVLGASLPEAVARANDFVRAAIERGRHMELGGGAGPLLPIALSAGSGVSLLES
jgi:hydroxymethylpyrimidine/phosphomethylpyrimidine kinase